MTMDNQYLKPEELPITDAKKSPLALLAMTCSNIGADILGAGKPMLGFEKSRKIRSDDSRSESVTSDKIQAHSIDSNRSNSRGSSDGGSKVSSSDGRKLNSSSGHKISFKPYEDLPKHRSSSPKRKERSPSPASSSRKTSSRSKSPESPNKHTPSSSSSVAHHSSSSESDKSKHSDLLQSQMNQHLKEKSKQQDLQSQMSQHHKIGSCRDPFCSGCQLSHLQNFLPSSSSCCSSFPHCVHAQAASHFASFPHPSLYASSLSRLGGNSSSSRPFLCHWTAGGSYCGRSFASCEELLQHLKTHTLSSSAVNSSSFPGFGSYLNPHSSLLNPGLAARHASSLDSLRYHPYKLNGGSHHALGSTLRSPSIAHSSNNMFMHHQHHPSSLTAPSMSVFHPTQHHPGLGSYYTLPN